MSLVIPNLAKDITIAGVSMNNVAESLSDGRGTLVGSRVDYFDPGVGEVVQFTEKLALADGLDYGAAYYGGRTLVIRGVTFAATRGGAYDLLSLIEAACRFTPGSFGLVTLAFTAITGAGGIDSAKSIQVRPNGLHAPMVRNKSGGAISDRIGIPWEVSFLAMRPAL